MPSKTISVLISFFLLFSFFQIKAQKITGSVKDMANKPIAGANVILQLSSDSSIVKINITDKSGQYSFTPQKTGKYFILFTNTGFTNIHSPTFELYNEDISMKVISMKKNTTILDELVIVAQKPMIEIKADKTIFNVEGSISAVGSDAMELLRKSPGVVVDRDDNIIMSGKNGVNIYIDGRPSPISGTALSAYLRSLPSSAIEAIEIITNPSSKYDAAGNAGIINIKLKKNNTFGTNGSVNTGYAIGVYPKYNAGISLNNRNKLVNVYGNYNINRSINENKLYVARTQSDTSFDQHSTTTGRSTNHLYKAGIDYYFDNFNTIGLIVNGNIEDKTNSVFSTTPIIYAPTKTTVRWLDADNSNIIDNNSLNLNMNFKHAGKTGNDLDMNADYGHYQLRSNQLQPNYYFNANHTVETDRRIYRMLAPSDINIFSYRTDYEQDYKKGKLGIGVKLSFVSSLNDFKQYNELNTGRIYDSSVSNKFEYKENINALYINYNRQFKNVFFQLGLRVENSNITGQSAGLRKINNNWSNYDTSFTLHYNNLFPSIAITLNKNPDNQWGIAYSCRIDRPAYQDLNPFEIKIDEYSSYKGNTSLRPQYTNSIGLSNSLKNKLNTRINYSHVKDVFTRVIDTVDNVKSFLIRKNVSTQHILSINISYNIQANWYSLFTNLNAFTTKYKADFGDGRKIDLSVNSATINIQQSAKLGKGWTIEMSGYYNSPSVWSGTFKSKELYGIDAGIQKQLFNKKGNIRIAYSDIFHTQWWRGVSDFAGQVLTAEYRWEAQQFKVNFSYRFGNSKIKAANQRKTVLDEEGKRVQSSGGLGN